MQVFWDLWIWWSNCPYFDAKKDLHWIYLVEKGKSGYSCQDAKFCSTPTYPGWPGLIFGVPNGPFLLSTVWKNQHLYCWQRILSWWTVRATPNPAESVPVLKWHRWSRPGVNPTMCPTWLVTLYNRPQECLVKIPSKVPPQLQNGHTPQSLHLMEIPKT